MIRSLAEEVHLDERYVGIKLRDTLSGLPFKDEAAAGGTGSSSACPPMALRPGEVVHGSGAITTATAPTRRDAEKGRRGASLRFGLGKADSRAKQAGGRSKPKAGAKAGTSKSPTKAVKSCVVM